ncbi:hypothetical protein ABH920_007459 [Catenulispora sp. EB89]|uniref:SHOCT domain-containing protein n=1 Tax=Catenulispora sp. EB89 TaxID=3156257 RepID=UPI003513DFFC
MMFGRPVVARRGPGLIGAAARTAVVAGTATAVAGGVRRRQADREAAPVPATDSIAELERLAALKQQGVLSDAEFAAAKAKVLGL